METLLLNKLGEELEEFKETPNEEEFADMVEVMDETATAFHLNTEKVRAVKAEKKSQKGGFKEPIVLQKVKSYPK